MPEDHHGDKISGLILRVSLRDRRAFDSLYHATAPKLFGTCLRILRDRAEAEEAVQEVFVKIWLKAGRFSVTGQSPMSWLIAIARNHAIDRLRSRRGASAGVTGALDDAAHDIRDPSPTPEGHVLAAAERTRLDSCLSQLDGERAAAVKGAYLDGHSYADLAERHGVPLNTMRTWLRRSLMRLKECLEP